MSQDNVVSKKSQFMIPGAHLDTLDGFIGSNVFR